MNHFQERLFWKNNLYFFHFFSLMLSHMDFWLHRMSHLLIVFLEVFKLIYGRLNKLQGITKYLAEPSKAWGCSTNTSVTPRHSQTVRDSSSSYKIEYAIVIKYFLNLKGHHNRITGSKAIAILVKGYQNSESLA